MVIDLAKIILYLDKKTKFAFTKITIIINLIFVIKFFYIICKALFISLLIIGKVEKKLLKLISNYFAIIETNKHRMFHLNYFI